MANDTAELVTLPTSPWSVKATWALDFSKADYDTTNYTPLSGERWLRRKTGKEDGLITVPVMFTPEGTLMDSFDIAQWADAHSQRDDGAKLFPPGQLEVIKKWDRAGNDVLDHWRAFLFTELQSDKNMRRKLMPPILNSLGPITDWLSSRRISSFSTKYDEASRASSAAKATLAHTVSMEQQAHEASEQASALQAEKALQELREAVKSNNGYVLGDFSYADITMAIAANTINPIGPPISKAPEPMRIPCSPEWKTQYADLVEYRDRIFKEYFPSTQ